MTSPSKGFSISDDTVVSAGNSQVSVDLNGEAVILNMHNGRYYGLGSTGARIWNLIQEPKPVRVVLSLLAEEYNVEPEVCRKDTLALLEKLASCNLIELGHESMRNV